MVHKILDNLSDEQKKPLGRNTNAAAILAGAGSGKTRTLIHLVADAIKTGITPENIILFTFTRSAAEELQSRISFLLEEVAPDIDPTRLNVGTIHSWCFDFLLEKDEFINFSPLDELHLDSLISRIYDFLDLTNVYSAPFPKGIPKFINDLEVFYNEHINIDELPETIKRPISVFEKTLFENRLISFGGMSRHAISFLQKSNGLKNLEAVFVDEYQDVNPAQVTLVQALLNKKSKLVVVGDDLQCIYQWRGSDVARILNFDKDFEDTEVFRLLDNYRSRPQIIEISNKFSESIKNKDPEKILEPKRPALDFDVVCWNSCETEEQEVKRVVKAVSNFAQQGIPLNKIAVLLRSVANRGKPFVDALREIGFPVICPLHGLSGNFIDTFLIPTLDWLLQEEVEPRNKVEERELEEKVKKLENSIASWITNDDGIENYWDQIASWQTLISEGKNEAYNIRHQLYKLMEDVGIGIKNRDNELATGLGIASQIIRSVEEIHRRRLAGQERKTARGVIKETLLAIQRNKESFGETVPIDEKAEGVVVSTIHQAKGLEWPIVIIPMLQKRRFPVNNNSYSSSFDSKITQRYGTSKDDERRLFYVALTRAKERLILTDPCLKTPEKRSEFLNYLENEKVISNNKLPKDNAQFWKVSEDDLKEESEATIRIGLSDLLLFLECPFQFGLRRHAGIQPPVGDELGFGLGLHELIQRRINHGKDWSREEISSNVEKHVHLPLMSKASEETSKIAINDRVKTLQKLGILNVNIEPEIQIETSFKNGIVQGIVDGLIKKKDGTCIIQDWKSNIHEELIKRYERQVRFYAIGLGKLGYKVAKAELVDVGASNQKGKLISLEVDISENKLTDFNNQIEKGLEQISLHHFIPSPSKLTCNNCDIKEVCGERVL